MKYLYALLSATFLFLTGCSFSAPSQTLLLQTASETATYTALKNVESPQVANETATALKTNINATLLPYLSGGNLPSSEIISAFINSSLFSNVSPGIKAAIILASAALDALLPVPSANTYLSSTHISYIKAFLVGVSLGADDFLSGKSLTKDIPPGKRREPKINWLK